MAIGVDSTSIAQINPTQHRVLLADSRSLFRSGLRCILERHEFKVTETPSGPEILDILEKHTTEIQLVILTQNLEVRTGIEVLSQMQVQSPDLPCLFVFDTENRDLILRATRAGAMGMVSVRIGEEEFLKAVHAVSESRRYVSVEVGTVLAAYAARDKGKGLLSKLSDREREVLDHLIRGETIQQIADALHIDRRTVSSHKRNLLHKLGLRSTWDLARFVKDNPIP